MDSIITCFDCDSSLVLVNDTDKIIALIEVSSGTNDISDKVRQALKDELCDGFSNVSIEFIDKTVINDYNKLFPFPVEIIDADGLHIDFYKLIKVNKY